MKRITVCADEVKEIAAVVVEVLKRKPKFVIVTGGLGPTFDDKTLQGIAQALKQKLVVNEVAFRMVQEKYAEYAVKREVSLGEMTAPRVKMATIPTVQRLFLIPSELRLAFALTLTERFWCRCQEFQPR